MDVVASIGKYSLVNLPALLPSALIRSFLFSLVVDDSVDLYRITCLLLFPLNVFFYQYRYRSERPCIFLIYLPRLGLIKIFIRIRRLSFSFTIINVWSTYFRQGGFLPFMIMCNSTTLRCMPPILPFHKWIQNYDISKFLIII